MTDETTFQLHLPGFSGDIDRLLHLAGERRVDLEGMQVAEIAAQYAAYLSGAHPLDLELIGDFLSGTARLLLLKSARLLACPAPESVQEQSLSVADSSLSKAYWGRLGDVLRSSERHESMSPLQPPASVERPIEPRRAEVLRRAWTEMRERSPSDRATVRIPAFVRLEGAVSSLIRRLRRSMRLSFQEISRGASRNDVVLHFLAILELIRRHEATVTQETVFSDIMVEQLERADEQASRAG